MRADIDWPNVDTRGLIRLSLSRSDLRLLLAGAECPVRGGVPGLVTVDGDLVVVVEAGE